MPETVSRSKGLLEEAVHAFEQGIDPFSTAWLDEHAVTLEEVYQLGETIAAIVKGYLASPIKVQVAILVLGASEKLVQ